MITYLSGWLLAAVLVALVYAVWRRGAKISRLTEVLTDIREISDKNHELNEDLTAQNLALKAAYRERGKELDEVRHELEKANTIIKNMGGESEQ